ncbi:MAG TPA: 2-amino-4-hydroxy-6-hydroxymethyldihydropteridine diphosphokinase [Anaerolineales bacterium]|nr:2-amino-4-hydroxy-6-hydroxymethyldihydropteridine diphosphokinase [Anaerolineales bacterium]
MFPILLGLGSNLGERFDNLTSAIKALTPEIMVQTISPTYETQPLYVTQQPEFLNLLVRATTTLSPISLLDSIQALEVELGRKPSVRFGPRIIDIDIIDYDSLILNLESLTIPHPRMHERLFVLRPLINIVPNWIHPRTGKTVQQLIDGLSDPGIVKKYIHAPSNKSTQ